MGRSTFRAAVIAFLLVVMILEGSIFRWILKSFLHILLNSTWICVKAGGSVIFRLLSDRILLSKDTPFEVTEVSAGALLVPIVVVISFPVAFLGYKVVEGLISAYQSRKSGRSASRIIGGLLVPLVRTFNKMVLSALAWLSLVSLLVNPVFHPLWNNNPLFASLFLFTALSLSSFFIKRAG